MRENSGKTISPIIILVIILGMIIGYQALTLSSVLTQKRQLTAQVEDLLKVKATLENKLSATASNIYFRKKAVQLSKFLRLKQEQLKEANAKLGALNTANDFLEKQLGLLQESEAPKGKVEVILTPEENQE